MSEELYNSSDYCSLAEQYEELKKENAELTADKIHLIQAAMDGGDRYHYTAHDIGYRDLERKVKALEADCSISNRELLILSVELARRDEIIARLKAELAELNDKAVFIQFENEDELPADISNDVYSTMFNCSHVDGVRLFPYIEENGQKYFLVMLREDE